MELNISENSYEKLNLHTNICSKPTFLSRDKEHGTCWGKNITINSMRE